MRQLHTYSAKQLHRLFVTGNVSAVQIVEHFLTRIHRHNKKLGAFLKVFDDKAIKQAKALDDKRAKGMPVGKMAAVPVGIKDNTHIKGEITTCGSKFLEHYKAPFHSSVARFMEEEDAIFIGKLNLDEFSMGSSNENSAYFPAYNPWNLSCTPGGSSGGSAAAVAARLIPLATGSDTGGSIRQPASFSGIVGFKPTYGRVSRYGLVAFGSSLDQIGPLAHTTEDVCLMMETIGRNCPFDSTSLDLPQESYLSSSPADLTGQVIGVPWNFLKDLKEDVRKNFESSVITLRNLGAEIIEIDLNILQYSVATYYMIATAEASTNLARFDGIRYTRRCESATDIETLYRTSRSEGFGEEVKRRILLGTFVLSSGHKEALYQKAQKIRTLISRAFDEAFKKCHLIVIPSSPTGAFTLNAFQDPMAMYLQDIFTVPANLAAIPAVSVPSGFDGEKKPLGIQILGPKLHDTHVLQAAHLYEQATKFTELVPKEFDD